MTTMYRLSPIIDSSKMVYDLPDRMYSLPVILKSMDEPTDNLEVTKEEMETLKELELRQENILKQLEGLKMDISKLQGGKETTTKGAKTSDLVIRASPQRPPYTLPILCTKLQQNLKISTSVHVHSSLPKGIPNKLEEFLPASNCDARSKADVCITLIWKDVKDIELVTSPTSTSIFKGETNLVRYLSRRFNLFNVNNAGDIAAAHTDLILDTIYSEICWGSAANVSKMASNILEPVLKKSQFLGDSKMTMADLYAFALVSNEKGKNSSAIQEWLKRCDKAIKSHQAPTGGASPRKTPHKKYERKRSPTKRNRTKSQNFENKPGSTLRHQWPEIESVYMSTEVMIEQLNENPVALVSEKLDGSNLSISSSGIISSRRKILLVNPSSQELQKTTFAGESLAIIEPYIKAAKSMVNGFAKYLQGVDIEVTIFGEWIQAGTASSKDDKFNYKQRNIEQGKLYGFGLGLTFAHQGLDLTELEKIKIVLEHHGFAAKVIDSGNIIVFLNGELSHLFAKFDIPTVPILQTLPFTKIFDKMADDLLKSRVEGFVITIPSKGLILKWKGYEDSDPRRIESFVDITDHCKLAEVIGPLNQVLQESILYNAHGKKRYLDPNLKDAFNSARSKFPRLGDILSNFSGNPKKKKEIIEGYKFTLVEEITKDFGKAFGCTKESIEAFVNHEVKP